MVFGLAASGTTLLAAVGFLVDGGPSSALGFIFGDAALFVTLFDMLGHPLLLAGITRFVSTGHGNLQLHARFPLNQQQAPLFQNFGRDRECGGSPNRLKHQARRCVEVARRWLGKKKSLPRRPGMCRCILPGIESRPKSHGHCNASLQGALPYKQIFRYLPQTLARSLRIVLFETSNMTRLSLNELHQRYVIERRPLETSLEEVLRADSRAGARAILASIAKRRFENRSEGQRLRKMLRFETLLWEKGHDAVAGIDEAGMSPLAGPVSAAAVILKPGTRIIGIDDSKKLDPSAREALAEEIKQKAAAWCVAFVEVEEIDSINIYWAGLLAMRRALEGLQSTPQHLLIDAKRLKEVAIPQQAIIKGDAKSASIAAASILAKVARDALMRELDTCYPDYGFADHKGYPVPAHYTALSKLGACAAHRRSFGPVREVLGLPPLPPWPLPSKHDS